MSLPDDKIEELVIGCVKGKQKYQQMLHGHYYGLLLSICLRYTKNYDIAEEVLQLAFIKIFKNLKKYEFKGSFEGWLKRITVNTAIDFIRSKKNALVLLPDEFDIENVEITDDFDEDDNFGYQYSPQQVMEAVQMLTPAYKAVFNLYVIEEYQHKEIAEMLDINIGTSKSNLLKAKVRIRKILDTKFKTKDPLSNDRF
jgi:RNA polymerase sigma-70 factor (ECF subfamily)